jgi:hypothetical protein
LTSIGPLLFAPESIKKVDRQATMSEGQEHKKYDLEGLDKDHSYDQHSVPIETYKLNQTPELDSGKPLDEIEQEPGVSRIETLCKLFVT